jgi:hypothetical protein
VTFSPLAAAGAAVGCASWPGAAVGCAAWPGAAVGATVAGAPPHALRSNAVSMSSPVTRAIAFIGFASFD